MALLVTEEIKSPSDEVVVGFQVPTPVPRVMRIAKSECRPLGVCISLGLVVAFFVFCVSCQSKDVNQKENKNIDNASPKVFSDLDTVYIQTLENSLAGFFYLSDSQLLFIDQIQSKVFAYALDGTLQSEFLGKGDGPDQQNGINGFTQSTDGYFILGDNHLSVFDRSFRLKKRSFISLEGKESHEEMFAFPTSDMFGLYEVDWKGKGTNTSFMTSDHGDGYLVPLAMSHPKLNGYWTREYYQSVAILGRFDQEFHLKKIGGKRSEEYLNHSYLPNLDFNFFTKKNDQLLVSFAIDPEIHVYDTAFNFSGKFGVPGIGMKTDYIGTQTLEEAESQFEIDMNQYGYYEHILFDANSGLLFRTYYPEGKEGESARLQIYQGEQLLEDLKVPLRFRVLGSRDGVFYADGIVDEENEKFGFYKFLIHER